MYFYVVHTREFLPMFFLNKIKLLSTSAYKLISNNLLIRSRLKHRVRFKNALISVYIQVKNLVLSIDYMYTCQCEAKPDK